MVKVSKKELRSALTKAIRSQQLNNLVASIIWQKEEKNVGKGIYPCCGVTSMPYYD